MKFLYFLNILAELIQLVFELGTLTRRYLVPCVVFVFVAIEFGYNKLFTSVTQMEYALKVYNTPLTTGLA